MDISGTKRSNMWELNFNELETNSKAKNVRDLYRSINDFKKGYQHKTNIVKDEKGDFLINSHSILSRWRTISVRSWMYMGLMMLDRHKVESLVPELSVFEFLDGCWKAKRHKSPIIDQIPAELIKAGVGQFDVINSIWNKEELPEEWRESLIVPKIVVIIEVYHFFQVHTKFCPTSCCQG